MALKAPRPHIRIRKAGDVYELEFRAAKNRQLHKVGSLKVPVTDKAGFQQEVQAWIDEVRKTHGKQKV